MPFMYGIKGWVMQNVRVVFEVYSHLHKGISATSGVMTSLAALV